VGRRRISFKHHRFSFGQLLAPAGALVMGICAFGATLGDAEFQELFAVFSSVYLGVILAVSVLLTISRRNVRYLFSLPVIFPIIHFGLGIGFLVDLAKSFSGGSAKPSNTNAPGPTSPTTPSRPAAPSAPLSAV